MIHNTKFCEYMAQKLGITLFADYGEYVKAFRIHNTVHVPLCGMFRMNPMTVTPIQDLFLASATANIEIAAEADNVEEVRNLLDSIATSCNGETVTMVDESGTLYTVTCSYSTASVGVERTAPNQTGKMIPIIMTAYYSIIQNGISSNDVQISIDGRPVFYTEFSINHQRVADAYATDEGVTRAAMLQSARSFDFVTPLLSTELGALYRKAIFENGDNNAHCFTIKFGDAFYAYIVTFGSAAGTARAPQNVGCNISLMEGDLETLNFGAKWTTKTVQGGTVTLNDTQTARKVVIWGDGTADMWDNTKGDNSSIEHVYASDKAHTIYIFTETVAARAAIRQPDTNYQFYAIEGNMSATLFASDAQDGGYWRRNCSIDWGDGATTEYNTMHSSADDIPAGASHTYGVSGVYTIKIYNNEDPLWISR